MAKSKNPELEQQRREQLLGAAIEMLAERSHRETTLDRIAKRAGVSKGMVTYYFASKDELIVAAIARYFELQSGLLAAIVEDDSVPERQRLRQLVEVAVPARAAVESQLRFLVEVWAFAKNNAEAMRLVRDAYLAFRESCQALIERGAERGFVTARDRRWVNVALNALLDGMAFQLLVDDSLDSAELRERIVELAESLLAPDTS